MPLHDPGHVTDAVEMLAVIVGLDTPTVEVAVDEHPAPEPVTV